MKKNILFGSILCTALLFTGCNDTTTPNENAGNNAVSNTSEWSDDLSDIFSKRDYETEYNVAESVLIQLQGSTASCNSNLVTITSDSITITEEGTYIVTGILDNGMLIVDTAKENKVQIVLDGASIHSETSAPLYIKQADKVFVTLAADSENTLSCGDSYEAIDDNNIDAAIFSKEDLTLNGEGSLTITSPAGHGIVSKDDLKVTSGSYDISASSHGLTARDTLGIADGNFTLNIGKDGLHCENDEDTTLGNIYIGGGSLAITSDDDGIHAGAALTITGGMITISESYEGLEGNSIDIFGGEINIVSSDDGLNAAGGNDQSGFGGPGGFGPGGGFGGGGDMFATDSDSYINISGGTLYVNSGGDGIDSNGNLTISGGYTIVQGPTNSGNGALDYGGEATVSGGTFLAIGALGMAQGFSTAEKQGSIMISCDTQKSGTTIELSDPEGNVLFSFVADKSFSSVLLSCPEIAEGVTYTLTAGSTTKEITMDSLLYSEGGHGGFGPGGFGGHGGFNGDKNRPGRK